MIADACVFSQQLLTTLHIAQHNAQTIIAQLVVCNITHTSYAKYTLTENLLFAFNESKRMSTGATTEILLVG